MKKIRIHWTLLLLISTYGYTQTEPQAGQWKTWFIPSGKAYRLANPPAQTSETKRIVELQKKLSPAGQQQIVYWNAGAPGFRWEELINQLWRRDTLYHGALANMLLAVATYDATIVAWDNKYIFNRPRPFAVDERIKTFAPKPESPSYPCEYSLASGVAVTIISHFFPSMADSVRHMASRQMESRVTAGLAYPSDTIAGFELGKKIAEEEIAKTSDFTPTKAWDNQRPVQSGIWTGKHPAMPLQGLCKTVVLSSSHALRPPPPPDFAKEMLEIKNQKETFGSLANAFYWASQDFWFEELNRKIFENNLQMNPPRAARIYAATAIGVYDGFTSCWDAKYAYWGIRPNQYDTSFHPAILMTPPFPGYPSGHAMLSSVAAVLYAYFFPADSAWFRSQAKDAAESRFQAGIHFRTDNEVGLEMGRKVGELIIEKVKEDGADDGMFIRDKKRTAAFRAAVQ